MNATTTASQTQAEAAPAVGAAASLAAAGAANPVARLRSTAQARAQAKANAQVVLPAAAKYLFFAMVLILALQVAVLLAEPALAQDSDPESGNASAIKEAGMAIFGWLADVLKVAGGIGLLLCAGLKAVAGSNDRRQAQANVGMVGCGIALLAGFLVPDIIALLEDFSEGSSGA